MTKRNMKQNETMQRRNPLSDERPSFSSATIKVAQRNLKEFQSQSDEGFLIRADMDRKLNSL